MTYEEKLANWKLQGKSIAEQCIADGTDVNDALALHQKDKPKDTPECIILDGDRLMIKMTKFAEYTKDGEIKVHGGNFALQLLDPRSKNKNGTPRYFMQGYYTAPAVAYLLDSLKATGTLDAKSFKEAQVKVWNHLPFCKHHKDASKKDSDVKCLNDNAGYEQSDLHWKVESK